MKLRRFLLLAVALASLPAAAIAFADWPQLFPLFDPPIIQRCAPGQNCCPPKTSAPSRLVPVPDPWTNTPAAPCKPGEKCPGHPIRRPLVPVAPKPSEPPAPYLPPPLAVSVEVGTVLTVGPDEPASVVIQEAAPGRYLLNFSIPKGRDGEDGNQGVQGRVGVSPTIDVKAIAREAAKELPAFFWVRRLDVATGEEKLEKIPLGEGFTILNFPPE